MIKIRINYIIFLNTILNFSIYFSGFPFCSRRFDRSCSFDAFSRRWPSRTVIICKKKNLKIISLRTTITFRLLSQHAFHHSRARINSQTSPHACEEDPHKISRRRWWWPSAHRRMVKHFVRLFLSLISLISLLLYYNCY